MKLNKLLLSTALAVTLNVFESNGAAQARLLDELKKEVGAYKALGRTPAELQQLQQDFEGVRIRQTQDAAALAESRRNLAEKDQLVRSLQERLGTPPQAVPMSGAPRIAAPDCSIRTNNLALEETLRAEQQFRALLEAKDAAILTMSGHARANTERLQTAYAQVQQELQAAQSTLAAKAQELLTKTEEQRGLLQKIQAEELVVQKAQREIEAVRAEKERALEEAREVQQRIVAAEAEKTHALEEARGQVQAISAEKEQALAQVAEVERARAEIEGQATQATQRVADLEFTLHQKEAALREAEEERNSLVAQIQDLSERAKRRDAVAEELASLTTKYDQSLKSIQKQQGEIGALKQEKSVLIEDVTRIEAAAQEVSVKLAELEELRKAQATLQEKTLQQEVALERLNAQLQEESRQRESLSAEIKDLKQKQTDANTALSLSDKQKVILEQEQQDLEQKLAQLQEFIQEIQGVSVGNAEIHQAKVEGLEKELDRLKKEHAALEAKTVEQELNLSRLQKQLVEAENKLGDKENALESLEAKYAQYLEAMNGIQGYAGAIAETGYLGRIKELEEELYVEGMRSHSSALEQELNEKKERISTLEDSLANAKRDKEESEVEFQRKILEFQATEKMAEEWVEMMQRHLTGEQEKVTKLRKEKRDFAKRFYSVNPESPNHSFLEGDSETSQNLFTLLHRVEHLAGLKRDLSAAQQTITEIKKSTSEQVENLKGQIRKLTKSLEEKGSELATERLEKETLQKDIDKKREEVRIIQAEGERLVETHVAERDQLRAKIHTLEAENAGLGRINESAGPTASSHASAILSNTPTPFGRTRLDDSVGGSALMDQLTELQAQLVAQAQALVEARAELASKNSELESLRDQINSGSPVESSSGGDSMTDESAIKMKQCAREIGDYLSSADRTYPVNNTSVDGPVDSSTVITGESMLSGVSTTPLSISDEEAVQDKKLFQEDFCTPFATQPRVIHSPQGGRPTPVGASTPAPLKKEDKPYGKDTEIFGKT